MAERRSKRNIRKSAEYLDILSEKESKAYSKKVGVILKKSEATRTEDEKLILQNSCEVVKNHEQRAQLREKQKQRKLEFEDTPEEIKKKCFQLATALKESKYVVFYTGAGISTAASIPDYRGPNGVWTLLEKGIQPPAVELSDADPTYTHMAIRELYSQNIVKYVVSQNCDGLHMRSGLPRTSMSELHGNMYLELCTECDPVHEHIRLCDTTQNTGLRKHKTGRTCHSCGSSLKDSIVHFGEKGPFHTPYNWEEAAKVADKADLVVCLGTTMKVIRHYACLWSMHKPANKRPKLFIINLQWTPKDDMSTLKINGKCDDIMSIVMKQLKLSVPSYEKIQDPIFAYALPLKKAEKESVNKKHLVEPSGYNKAEVLETIRKRAHEPIDISSSGEEDPESESDTEIPPGRKYKQKKDVVNDTETKVRVGRGRPPGKFTKIKKAATARKSVRSCNETVLKEDNKITSVLHNGDHNAVKCSSYMLDFDDDSEDVFIVDGDKACDVVDDNNDDNACDESKDGSCCEKSEMINGNEVNGNHARQRGRRKKRGKGRWTRIKGKNTPLEKTPIKKEVPAVEETETKIPIKKYNFRSSSVTKQHITNSNNTPSLCRKELKIVLNSNFVTKWFEEHLPDGTLKARVRYKNRSKHKSKELLSSIQTFVGKRSTKSNALKRKRCEADTNEIQVSGNEGPSVPKKRQTDGNTTWYKLPDENPPNNTDHANVMSINSKSNLLYSGTTSGVCSKTHTTQQFAQPPIPPTSTTTRQQPSTSETSGISGDQALSFLAMEEACDLPDLTLDSRKVWACYSSWFTALYQSLQQQRDFLGSRQSSIYADPSTVDDPEVINTAMEQNTVLLANLAVHDLDKEQSDERSSSSCHPSSVNICSPCSATNCTMLSSPISCTSNYRNSSQLSSPVQFIESGSSAHLSVPSVKPRAGRKQHSPSKIGNISSNNKASISNCTLSAPPKPVPQSSNIDGNDKDEHKGVQVESQQQEFGRNSSGVSVCSEQSNQSSVFVDSCNNGTEAGGSVRVDKVYSISSTESEEPTSPPVQITTPVTDEGNQLNVFVPVILSNPPLLVTSAPNRLLSPLSIGNSPPTILISPPIIIAPVDQDSNPTAANQNINSKDIPQNILNDTSDAIRRNSTGPFIVESSNNPTIIPKVEHSQTNKGLAKRRGSTSHRKLVAGEEGSSVLNAEALAQLQQQSSGSSTSSNSIKRRHSAASSTTSDGGQSSTSNMAMFAFPEGATGRGPYRSRGRPPNKPGSPVEDPNDAISKIVKKHIENIKEKTATIVENKEHVLQTLGTSAPGWFGRGCRFNNKRRKKST